MMTRAVVTLLLATSCLASVALGASKRERLVVGKDISILHPDAQLMLHGKALYLEPPDKEQIAHDGDILVQLSGIIPNPVAVRRSVGLKNAFATFRDGYRIIVYDDDWYGGTFSGHATRYLLLGHEMGHHICGHTIGAMREDPWARELEADRYAGAAVKHAAPASFEAAVSGMYPLLMEQGTDTHPPREMRIAAYRDGYKNGSPCQNSGIVKPAPGLTAEETDKLERAGCMQLVRELCQSKNAFQVDAAYHALSINNCGTPPAVRLSTGGVAYPGVDCQNGGRFTVGKFKE